MASVDERVAVVEQRVDGLEKWRTEHCVDNERNIEALTKLPAEIATLVAKVDQLVVTNTNLWVLIRWLVLALIALSFAAWGLRELLPVVLKGGV